LDNLSHLRKKIDGLDDEILRLLNERARLVLDIGREKAKLSSVPHVPEREREILERLTASNPGPFPNDGIRTLYREIFAVSVALESPTTVVYLGPEATYAHQASQRYFGSGVSLVPLGTIPAIFREVESDRATFGLVPVENSIEGMVSHTLDLLMEFDLKICGEVFLKITHYLVSIANTLGYVKRIYSHSQALAQCRQWIEHNLPRAELVELTSTARAAERAREEEGAAAVASLLAAELYGLSVLARGIEDNPHNYTRFLVIGKKPPAPSGNDKTSILFSVKDAPGALFKALSPFAEQKVNLTKIESRPSKKKPWEYVFFVDMAGHLEEEAVRKALEELWADAVDLRVLGSYPRGEMA